MKPIETSIGHDRQNIRPAGRATIIADSASRSISTGQISDASINGATVESSIAATKTTAAPAISGPRNSGRTPR